MRAFKLTEESLHPSCRVIAVEGELDLAVAAQLREAIAGEPVAALLLVDLARCDFIDSTAIAVIVHAHQELRAEGRRLSVCSPTSQVQRVLSVTGLSGIDGFVFPSRDAAQQAAAELASG